MIKFCVTLISLLLPCIVYGSGLSGYFSGLEKVGIEHDGSRAGYFYYPADAAVIVNDLNEGLTEQNGYPVTDLAIITLQIEPGNRYLITYDEGGSRGPTFTLYNMEGTDKKSMGRVSGMDLYWPASRTRNFYTTGHVHSMYDMKRKYTLMHDQIDEIEQPFYYVGLESTLKKNIVLYASKQLDKEVGLLPEGASVTVLLEENDFYLLKTSFGLVGWIHIEKSRDDTVVKDLYYRDR